MPARLFGIAWKNGIVRRETRSGAALVRLIRSVVALGAVTPEIFVALPSTTACRPAMTSMKGVDGDCSLGLALRLNASTKLAAVTLLPSENLYVLFSLIV